MHEWRAVHAPQTGNVGVRERPGQCRDGSPRAADDGIGRLRSESIRDVHADLLGPAARWRVPLEAGSTFAGFRIVRKIGEGGMGEVYLVEHPRLPREEALKVLPENVTSDDEYRQRFGREAELASTLWHPNLISLHDRGETEGRLWISMDFINGSDTGELMRTGYRGGMPVAEVAEIVTGVGSALDYAHQQGMLHRDVKPANILRTGPEAGKQRVALADFGIARKLEDSDGLTSTNLTVGTVAYAAPEQLMGSAIDGRADQYALAATAFHLLTGSPPFQSTNPVAVISQHLSLAPPKLSDYRAELAPLDEVFAKALAKDPEDRFTTCTEFADAFVGTANTYIDKDVIGFGANVIPAAPSAPTLPAVPIVDPGSALKSYASRDNTTRRRWLVVGSVAAVVAVAGGVVWAQPAIFTKQETGTTTTATTPPTQPVPSAPLLDGTFRIDFAPEMTANDLKLPNQTLTTWWAFRTGCRPEGCVATAMKLDDETHQKAATGPAEFASLLTKELQYVDGKWRELPPEAETRSCSSSSDVSANYATQWTLSRQSNGTFSGAQRTVITSNECATQGLTMTLPMVVTRMGDVPQGVSVANPASVQNVPFPGLLGPTPGRECNEPGKVIYDTTTNSEIVCNKTVWATAPAIFGVKQVGAPCTPDPDQPRSISTDGYLLTCSYRMGNNPPAWEKGHYP